MTSLAWIYLLIAGLMEPCWVVGMKRSRGFKDLKWTAFTFLFIFLSMYFLAVTIDLGIPMGTAYGVWTGIGAVGALVAGAVLFKEKLARARLFFITLLIIGIAGVQLTAGA